MLLGRPDLDRQLPQPTAQPSGLHPRRRQHLGHPECARVVRLKALPSRYADERKRVLVLIAARGLAFAKSITPAGHLGWFREASKWLGLVNCVGWMASGVAGQY
jgi:hypothetical protein